MRGTMSLPTRGAWIEMVLRAEAARLLHGRSPHGERGLKYCVAIQSCQKVAVAPHTGSVD